ncbi:MAG: endonuclease III [Blautia sp.]|jgi:endonuclease-3
MQKKEMQMVLDRLDELYGVTKQGFYHKEPWQLLLAIMLSAQSTDKQVDEILPKLFGKYTKAEDMAQAPVEEIESYIRSVGLYKNKAKNMKRCCQQIVEEYGGKVPDTMEELLKLAGVGRKTANLFLSDAYGIPGVTVDTHVFRISKRLGWAEGKNPQEVELELRQVLPREHWIRINFQLIYHGRAICTARKANCEVCPLEKWCPKCGVENQTR